MRFTVCIIVLTTYLVTVFFPSADPGFDVMEMGGVDFVNVGGGRKSLKVLTVRV